MEEKLSRTEVLDSFFNSFLSRILTKRSKSHLNNNYPQLLSWQFDGISNGITISGIYEKRYLINTVKFLNEKGFLHGDAIDIGANIGNHSVFFSTYFKNVYAIEPNPKIFKVLSINIEDRNNILAYNIGLGREESEGYVRMSNEQNMMSAKVHEGKPNNAQESDYKLIDIKKLDNFSKEIESTIGILKIDVEGMELEVLKGGINTIRKYKPAIIFEQHKNDFNNGISEVIQFVKSLNYEIYVAGHKPKRSANIYKIRKLFNFTKSLVIGASFVIERDDSPTPDFYPMLIGLPKD